MPMYNLLCLFQKMPVVHICDDACTFVSHSLLRYPIEAEIAFGQKRGCFQKPNDTVEPLTNISCPDITPIELEQRKPNREAMLNPSQLVHPDVTNQTRYVLGTRFVNKFFKLFVPFWLFCQKWVHCIYPGFTISINKLQPLRIFLKVVFI